MTANAFASATAPRCIAALRANQRFNRTHPDGARRGPATGSMIECR